MICRYCGKELKDTDKFCKYCGRRLVTDEAAYDVTPQEPETNDTLPEAADTETAELEAVAGVSGGVPESEKGEAKPAPEKKGGGKKAAVIIVIILIAAAVCAAAYYFIAVKDPEADNEETAEVLDEEEPEETVSDEEEPEEELAAETEAEEEELKYVLDSYVLYDQNGDEYGSGVMEYDENDHLVSQTYTQSDGVVEVTLYDNEYYDDNFTLKTSKRYMEEYESDIVVVVTYYYDEDGSLLYYVYEETEGDDVYRLTQDSQMHVLEEFWDIPSTGEYYLYRYEYNEDGKAVLYEDVADSEGTLNQRITYEYNEDGILYSSLNEGFTDGEVTSSVILYYDEDLNIVSWESEMESATDGVLYYLGHSDGETAAVVTLNEDGSTVTEVTDGYEMKDGMYYYELTSTLDTEVDHIDYEYDENGNKTKETYFTRNDDLMYWYEYEYRLSVVNDIE